MSYRPYYPPQPLLFGYDPVRDLPPDHLARLVEQVVEETVIPPRRAPGVGQPPYDPRLCVKVLIYGYSTGIRSSRRLEQACDESLPFLYLTRGDTPSYRTLCTARTEQGELLQAVWEGLFAIAAAVGLTRVGRVVVDSSRLRADVGPEAVLRREEFAAMRAELERILAEAATAEAADAEAAAGGARGTRLGTVVPHEHMREILRRMRGAASSPAPSRPAGGHPTGEPTAAPTAPSVSATLPLEDVPARATPEVPPADPTDPEVSPMTLRMLARVQQALRALAAAEADGRKHLGLTDPDARMMPLGRERHVREGHAWEIAVDAGLLVAALTTQANTDQERLAPLLAAAELQEPAGIQAVDADSGYYTGDAVAALAQAGIDTCIPDSQTAGDLHRSQEIGTCRARRGGQVPFTYDAAADLYRCPEGNLLRFERQRHRKGQEVRLYKAARPCTGCPLAADCLVQVETEYRTLAMGVHHELLGELRKRFREPDHVTRYHRRGDAVETVFGFLRGVLGYVRWQLRGAQKIACEGQLFAAAYQFRKVHTAMRAALQS